MTDITHKTAIEKTVRDEVIQKAAKMSTIEINRKINSFIEILANGKLEGEALLMAQEKAKIYAELWLRRTKNR